MKFAYTKFPSRDPRKPWFSRPIISVILTHRQSTFVVALVDSGADRSLFDVEVGKDIGLNIERGEVEYFGGICLLGLNIVGQKLSGISQQIGRRLAQHICSYFFRFLFSFEHCEYQAGSNVVYDAELNCMIRIFRFVGFSAS